MGNIMRPSILENPLRGTKAYESLLFSSLFTMPYGAPIPQPTQEKAIQAPCHSIPKKQYVRGKKRRKVAAASRRKNR